MPQDPYIKQARRIIRNENPTLDAAKLTYQEIAKNLERAWEYYFYALDVAKTGFYGDDARVERAYNTILDLTRDLAIAKIVASRIEQGLADRD